MAQWELGFGPLKFERYRRKSLRLETYPHAKLSGTDRCGGASPHLATMAKPSGMDGCGGASPSYHGLSIIDGSGAGIEVQGR